MIINGNRIDLLEDMQTVMVERKEKEYYFSFHNIRHDIFSTCCDMEVTTKSSDGESKDTFGMTIIGENISDTCRIAEMFYDAMRTNESFGVFTLVNEHPVSGKRIQVKEKDTDGKEKQVTIIFYVKGVI